jgi:acetoin utilization protein AcuB
VSAPPVADWMHSPVHTVTPATRTGDALALLRQHRIRHLPVMDGDRVVGVVTDRDLRGVETDTPVAHRMSRPAQVVSPRAGIDRAARLLFDRRIGCLPVVEDGKLVGILTQTDALAALVEVLRLQVGGPRAEIVLEWSPDAMVRAQRAIRPLGAEVARLVAATHEPLARGRQPERVRLAVDTRDPAAVMTALRAAGLVVVAAADDEAAR